MAKIKATSLVQARRRNLLKQPQTKGDPRKKNLWVVRAFDGSRVVLGSDLALHHFFFTEGDPSVSSACYPYIHAASTPDDNGDLCFDALVTNRDGSKVCRHVRAAAWDLSASQQPAQARRCVQAAREAGALYVHVTAEQLDNAVQRIRNWARLLAAYRRCSHRPLDVLEKLLMARLSSDGETTIRCALNWAPQESRALVIAALARLLRKRQIASDLDQATLSYHTRLWMDSP